MRTNDIFAYNKLTINKLHLYTKYGHILPKKKKKRLSRAFSRY